MIVGVMSYFFLKGSDQLRGLGDIAANQNDVAVRLYALEKKKKKKFKDHTSDDGIDIEDIDDDGLETSKIKVKWSCSQMLENTLILLQNRTFLLLFLRSALDGIPMNANSLLILWFEYMGYAESGRCSRVYIDGVVLCCPLFFLILSRVIVWFLQLTVVNKLKIVELCVKKNVFEK